MTSQNGICKIHPAKGQLTAAHVDGIAMIRNSVVWIHRLIKHCLLKLNLAISRYACVCKRQVKGRLKKQYVNNFWCDLFHDASRTMRSGAMNTNKITILTSNFENIVLDSCANFREFPLVAFHARSRYSGMRYSGTCLTVYAYAFYLLRGVYQYITHLMRICNQCHTPIV